MVATCGLWRVVLVRSWILARTLQLNYTALIL
jgi:hypothetical protein